MEKSTDRSMRPPQPRPPTYKRPSRSVFPHSDASGAGATHEVTTTTITTTSSKVYSALPMVIESDDYGSAGDTDYDPQYNSKNNGEGKHLADEFLARATVSGSGSASAAAAAAAASPYSPKPRSNPFDRRPTAQRTEKITPPTAPVKPAAYAASMVIESDVIEDNTGVDTRSSEAPDAPSGDFVLYHANPRRSIDRSSGEFLLKQKTDERNRAMNRAWAEVPSHTLLTKEGALADRGAVAKTFQMSVLRHSSHLQNSPAAMHDLLSTCVVLPPLRLCLNWADWNSYAVSGFITMTQCLLPSPLNNVTFSHLMILLLTTSEWAFTVSEADEMATLNTLTPKITNESLGRFEIIAAGVIEEMGVSGLFDWKDSSLAKPKSVMYCSAKHTSIRCSTAVFTVLCPPTASHLHVVDDAVTRTWYRLTAPGASTHQIIQCPLDVHRTIRQKLLERYWHAQADDAKSAKTSVSSGSASAAAAAVSAPPAVTATTTTNTTTPSPLLQSICVLEDVRYGGKPRRLSHLAALFTASWFTNEFPQYMSDIWHSVFAKSVGITDIGPFIENMDWAAKFDMRHYTCLPILIAIAVGYRQSDILYKPSTAS